MVFGGDAVADAPAHTRRAPRSAKRIENHSMRADPFGGIMKSAASAKSGETSWRKTNLPAQRLYVLRVPRSILRARWHGPSTTLVASAALNLGRRIVLSLADRAARSVEPGLAELGLRAANRRSLAAVVAGAVSYMVGSVAAQGVRRRRGASSFSNRRRRSSVLAAAKVLGR